MSFSDYLENEILDHILGNALWTAPTTVYVALGTGASDAGLTGEPAVGSYERVAVTNDLTNWPASSGGAKSNGIELVFPTATADWGTMTHFAIYDSLTSGNMLISGTLSASKTIGVDATPRIPVGDLDVTLD